MMGLDILLNRRFPSKHHIHVSDHNHRAREKGEYPTSRQRKYSSLPYQMQKRINLPGNLIHHFSVGIDHLHDDWH